MGWSPRQSYTYLVCISCPFCFRDACFLFILGLMGGGGSLKLPRLNTLNKYISNISASDFTVKTTTYRTRIPDVHQSLPCCSLSTS